MAQVFTAVIRARQHGIIKAELEVYSNWDRKMAEYWIETATAYPSIQQAVDFLKGFYSDSIVSVEMKM